MIFIRLLAQIIDIAAFIGSFVLSWFLIPPLLSPLIGSDTVVGIVVFAVAVVLIVGIQSLFMKEGQTIGKAFFSLKVVSSDENRPLDRSILMQREVFCKLMSCFFICVPMFFGKPGGHEEATQTMVIRAPRTRQKAVKKRV